MIFIFSYIISIKMYFFILGSSFIIATLIYKSINDCLTNKYHTNDDYIYIERLRKNASI